MVSMRISIFYDFYKSDKEKPNDKWDNKWEGRIVEMEKINSRRIPHSIWELLVLLLNNP